MCPVGTGRGTGGNGSFPPHGASNVQGKGKLRRQRSGARADRSPAPPPPPPPPRASSPLSPLSLLPPPSLLLLLLEPPRPSSSEPPPLAPSPAGAVLVPAALPSASHPAAGGAGARSARRRHRLGAATRRVMRLRIARLPGDIRDMPSRLRDASACAPRPPEPSLGIAIERVTDAAPPSCGSSAPRPSRPQRSSMLAACTSSVTFTLGSPLLASDGARRARSGTIDVSEPAWKRGVASWAFSVSEWSLPLAALRPMLAGLPGGGGGGGGGGGDRRPGPAWAAPWGSALPAGRAAPSAWAGDRLARPSDGERFAAGCESPSSLCGEGSVGPGMPPALPSSTAGCSTICGPQTVDPANPEIRRRVADGLQRLLALPRSQHGWRGRGRDEQRRGAGPSARPRRLSDGARGRCCGAAWCVAMHSASGGPRAGARLCAAVRPACKV